MVLILFLFDDEIIHTRTHQNKGNPEVHYQNIFFSKKTFELVDQAGALTVFQLVAFVLFNVFTDLDGR